MEDKNNSELKKLERDLKEATSRIKEKTKIKDAPALIPMLIERYVKSKSSVEDLEKYSKAIDRYESLCDEGELDALTSQVAYRWINRARNAINEKREELI